MSTHLTPLRYPGGKQKIAPFFRDLVSTAHLAGNHYIEPYAGGAGVAVDLLVNDLVGFVHINDISYPIYAFWRSVVEDTDNLVRLVRDTPLTVDEWDRRKTIISNPLYNSTLDVGFSLFYLNRCNRSGVIDGGMIGGRSQIGPWTMGSRYPVAELVARIERIAALSDRIFVTNQDAEQLLLGLARLLPNDSLVYCDPPYYSLRSRLYYNRYSPADHYRLANTIRSSCPFHWVVSYDDTPEIRDLYSGYRGVPYKLQYSAYSSYRGNEILIFSNGLRIPESTSVGSIDRALAASSTDKTGGLRPLLPHAWPASI